VKAVCLETCTHGLTGAEFQRWDLATQHKSAIRIKPDYAEAHYGLGVTYKDKGNSEQAITHLKEFIRLAEANPHLQSHIPKAQRFIRELKDGGSNK